MRVRVIRYPVRGEGVEHALQEVLDGIEGLGATVRSVSSAMWGNDHMAEIVYTILYDDPVLMEGELPRKGLVS